MAVSGPVHGPALREAPARGEGSTASYNLSSYVSRLVADRMATGGPIEELEATTVRAALLLTDIVGFSAYVDRVSAAGPTGLEELARDFDSYFTNVVGIVHSHGGDVLTTAGDAFFSYWPASDDDQLVDGVLHAAEAGLAIQRTLRDPARPVVHRFQSRAGVSAGELQIAFVGGIDSRWEVMPVGRPIAEVARAERLAAPGTVALAEPAWRLVASRCEGHPVDGGLCAVTAIRVPAGPVQVAPDSSGLPDELIEPFVPLPVRRRQIAGTEWMQEIRRVTVVMASLPTAATGAAALEMQHLGVRAFQRAIARFEGASKLLVDNKVVTLCGIFGLPPHAHADDATRAVTAAELIRRELEDAGLLSTIGVATGHGFCGVFGDHLRREYTLHGGVMNLAAGLMQASRGEILCAGETVRTAGASLRFEALEPLRIKGSDTPVEVHRASRVRPTGGANRLAIVGRKPERELLEARIDELATRDTSATVLVVGEPGLGKSRLVAEATRLARGRGVRVLAAASDPVESATSYYAWRSVFTELLELTPAAIADPHALQVACDPELRRLRPLLSSIVPVGIPDNALTAAMDGNVRAENTKLLLASILRHATAAAPVLVVIEDAHWLDSNSWALLLAVVQSVQRALFVVTTRPASDLPEEYGRLRERASTDVLVLSPLSHGEIATLVEQQLGVTCLPAQLTDFVEDRVAGHPLFCEQLVQMMREGGLVRVDGDAAVVGRLERVSVPATIEGAVLSRIDRLTPRQLICLKVAAVVGGTFEVDTVADTLPMDHERGAVRADLETLATLELTVRETDGAYRFGHEITRDVAYALLTTAQSRQLHRAVATWHEGTYAAEELVPHYALLAHHWARASDPDKAVTYLERAGRQALRSGAFREALLFLTDAIDVKGAKPDPIRDALCLKGIGTAHYFLGDFQRSRACLAKSVARLARPFPSTRVGVVTGLARAAGVQVTHLVRPSRYWERRPADKALIAEALECYKAIGQIGYLSGEPTAVLLYGTLAALNLGEAAGPSPDLARILIHAATASSFVGLERQADRYAARAIAMVDAGAQREAGAYVWNVWAIIGSHRGHWARAEAANTTALERLGEVGDFNLEAEIWLTRSMIYIASGAFGSADSAWQRHRELAERKGNRQNLCWSLLDEAQARVGRDEIEGADQALASALDIPTAPDDGSSAIEKHYATALVRAAQGRYREAVEAADAIVAINAAKPPAAFHYVHFCAEAIGVYFDALEAGEGDRAALLRRTERGCRLVRRAARSFGSVRSRRWLLQGKLDWEADRPERARRAWRRAEATAVSIDAQYELARARYEIARHGGAGAEQQAYLGDAAATLERLGALQMLRRVREAHGEISSKETMR
jgi:class 3 adenylate cyclase/tetratricopeptide (TPR) repeat protein